MSKLASHLRFFLFSFLWIFTYLHATEIETMRERIHDDFVLKTDKSEAATFLSTQQADGSWTDLNYTDRDASYWTPIIHLRRLRAIATAYYSSGHALENDPNAMAAVELGLTYWLGRNDIYSSNWWHQEVNTAQQLGAILIIAYDDLAQSILDDGAAELLALRNLHSDTYWSSQNTLYTSFSRVYRPLIINDAAELATQFERIKAQAAYKTGLGRTGVTNNNSKEGVRIDYSFYQHGPALYNGFYGAHYVTDLGFWMAMSEGLSLAFTAAQKEVVQDYVLEGHRWTNRYGVLDPNITNRKISHDNYDYVTLRYHDPIVYGLEYLRDLSLPRSAEIEAFYQHMVNGVAPVISGNRSFWKTDFMVQAGAGYQVSTKLWSYHNEGTEYINGDGRQGQFLSLGGTFLMREGDEYLEIFPIWDWGRVPGTTTLHRDPANPPNGNLGSQKFAGGVSNGLEGAMTYDHNYDSVQAKKSWFYFADSYVMLGAGIQGSSSSLDVNTTVEQIFLDGDITISQNGVETVLASGEHTPANLEWVYHDEVGYVFPNGGDVFVAGKSQSGSWFGINDSLPSTILTEDVFSVWFDHGRQPSDETYAVIVVPSVGRAAFDTFRTSEVIDVLSNTAALQAVRHNPRQLIQVSFQEAGTLTTPEGMKLTASDPCLVMVDESVSPALITVADPTQELASLRIVFEPVSGDPRNLLFTLPIGDEAGKSTQVAEENQLFDDTGLANFYGSVGSGYGDADSGAPLTIIDSGNGLVLSGNSWKKFSLGEGYLTTDLTVISFSMESDDAGELLAVALEEDEVADNAPRFMQLGGSASPGFAMQVSPSYVAGSGERYYELRLSDFYNSGPLMQYLVFVAQDEADASGEMTIRNLRLFEKPLPGEAGLLGTVIDFSGQSGSAPNNGDADYLTDGILDDDDLRWATNANWGSSYFELDLGSHYVLSSVRAFMFSGRAYQYTVEVKREGGDYVEVVDRSGNTDGDNPADGFAPIYGRYVRVSVNGASGYTGPWTSMNEFQTFGEIPTPYENWRYNLDWGDVPEDGRDPDDDPDGDGVLNFEERAVGGDPTTADAGTGWDQEVRSEWDGAVTLCVYYAKQAAELNYELYAGSAVDALSPVVATESFNEVRGLYQQCWTADSAMGTAFVQLKISE